MTPTMWRSALHRFIVVIGFMALLTVTTEAKLGPIPLQPLISQSERGEVVCAIEEEQNEHGKRFTHVQR